MSAVISRIFLGLMSLGFILLCIQMMVAGPIVALEPHGIDISSQPASGLAEFRAYYAGSQAVFAALFLRGALPSSRGTHRMDSLNVARGLMGCFALVRVYCYFADGPPNHNHAHLIWGLEAFLFVASSLLYRMESKLLTKSTNYTK